MSHRTTTTPKTQKDGNAKSVLDIEIKNFGPIVSGKISVKPMTVLMGPNNSGKSYAALLIHSILNQSTSPIKFPPCITKPIHELLASKKLPLVMERDAASNISKHLTSEIVDDIYVRIGRFFSGNFQSLVRMGSKKCSLQIHTERFSANLDLPNKKTRISVSDFSIKFESGARPSVPGTMMVYVPYLDESYRTRRRLLPINRTVIFTLSSIRYQMRPLGSFYLPASRSGILQGHKALSASIVRHAPFVGLRDVEVPKLSGVVSDFVGDMLEMERPLDNLPFYDVAVAMEDEILHGRVKLTRSLLPEIKFSQQERDFSLDLASSTVSEMAPLILYLKHIIAKPGLLIIEEPEAHLHPHNQTVLVKFLARLVRQGMKVLITTHSPFIVEKLSNLIQTSAAPDAGSDASADRAPFIMPAEVSAYSFESTPSQKHTLSGYTIRELEVSKESGLQSEEFVKVTAKLYDDFLQIQDSVEGDRQRR